MVITTNNAWNAGARECVSEDMFIHLKSAGRNSVRRTQRKDAIVYTPAARTGKAKWINKQLQEVMTKATTKTSLLKFAKRIERDYPKNNRVQQGNLGKFQCKYKKEKKKFPSYTYIHRQLGAWMAAMTVVTLIALSRQASLICHQAGLRVTVTPGWLITRSPWGSLRWLNTCRTHAQQGGRAVVH